MGNLQELSDLKNKISSAEKEMALREKTLAESHLIELKSKQQIIDLKDDEISRIKDMKSNLEKINMKYLKHLFQKMIL